MKKRWIPALLSGMMISAAVTGCNNGGAETTAASGAESQSVQETEETADVYKRQPQII